MEQVAQALHDAPGVRRSVLPDGRFPFEFDAISLGARRHPVVQRDLLARPSGVLTEFSARPSARRILVVAPLAGAFPVLLRDLVIGLLRHARVAVTDWRDACRIPLRHGRMGLAENIAAVVDFLSALGPDLTVIGICQGAVPALAATALIAARDPRAAPRCLILMAGPIDPLARATRAAGLSGSASLRFLEDTVFERVPGGFPGAGRLIYPASAQMTVLTSYIARHTLQGGEMFWKLWLDDGEDPVRFPFARLCCSMMNLPAELIRDTIEHVFRGRALCTGTLTAVGARVDPGAIDRSALMTVEGALDDIAAPGQTHAAHALCTSLPEAMHRAVMVEGSGHFSLFHGHLWRTRVLPEILRFMDEAAGHEASRSGHHGRSLAQRP